MANRNQVNGETKDLAGKVKEEGGTLVGNIEQKADGFKKQAKGQTEKAFGDVEEGVTDGTNDLKDAVKNHYRVLH